MYLREVEKTVPKKQEIHIAWTNMPRIEQRECGWIERQRQQCNSPPPAHRRVSLEERFFCEGIRASLSHLEKRLRQYLHADDPRRLVGTKTVDEIVEDGPSDGHHTRVKWLSEREACKNVQNCLWDVDWPYENVVLACKQVITRSCLNFPNRCDDIVQEACKKYPDVCGTECWLRLL